MNLVQKFFKLFAPAAPSGENNTLWLAVECHRCHEIVRVRINLNNDLSIEYGDNGGTTYFCRKLVVGENRCFQQIEIGLTFDANRRLVDKTITGGKFVEEGG